MAVEDVLITKDIPIMVITTIACMPIFWSNGKISRGEGGFLLGLYMLYLADKIIPLTSPLLYSGYKELVFLVPTGSQMEKAGKKLGMKVAAEIFADRNYEDDGNLISRN